VSIDAATLEQGYASAREVTRHHAKSFYFASIALPREKKDAAYAVYAFCRYADDVVDETPDDAPAALAKIEREYDRMTAGNTSEPAFAPAFAWAVQRYGVPKEPFMELLEGVARDQGRVRIATWEELRDYCWHVASTVGLMMARIFELRDERGVEHAVELGIAQVAVAAPFLAVAANLHEADGAELPRRTTGRQEHRVVDLRNARELHPANDGIR
jgi:phytoene synthase